MTSSASEPSAEALSETVARRTRRVIGEDQLSQARIARALGLSSTAMSNRVTGLMEFRLSEVPALADALGVSMEFMLGMTDERSPRQTGGGSHFVAREEVTSSALGLNWLPRLDSNQQPCDLRFAQVRAGVVVDLDAERARRRPGSINKPAEVSA